MKRKIMVVDDDSDLRYTIKDDLEDLYPNQFEVITAENGKQCFELLEDNQIPDLILLDIMMPDMSGWAVRERLKKFDSPWKNIPIIFLSARTDDTAKKAGRWFGEDFIEKPYNIEDLSERINKVLQKVKD